MNYLAAQIVILSVLLGLPLETRAGRPPLELVLFYSPGCRSCDRVKEEILPTILPEFADSVTITHLDIERLENFKRLLDAEAAGEVIGSGPPQLAIGKRVLRGPDAIRQHLRSFILDELSAIPEAAPPTPQETPTSGPSALDALLARFQTFRALPVALAGLLDGINPCAFTVMVFFVSLLAIRHLSTSQMLTLGCAFLAGVFVTYLLLGLGLLHVMHVLRGYRIVAKMLHWALAALTAALGLLSLLDYWSVKQSKNPAAMRLKLPEVVSRQIHRFLRGAVHEGDSELATWPLVVTGLGTGVVVSVFEGICTGQVYVPTIAFVASVPEMRLRAMFYLLLYNIMFLMPLVVIFAAGLFGVRSQSFQRIGRQYVEPVKLLTALLFFGLTALLVATA